MSRPGRIAALFAVTFVAAAVMVADAQIPQTFKNLRVLPKDITRPELMMQMREMAGSLGVRCGHCHAGGDPATLEGVDFASDSFETKRIARVMMRMTRDINASWLPTIGRDTTRMAKVTCATCHRGARRPEMLSDTLLRAVDRGGVPEAIASYRALRQQYYGRAVYDFGEGALSWISELTARRTGRSEDAVPLLELNLEFYPRSVNTLTALGDRMMMKGDTTAAIARWKQALELNPTSTFLQGKLDAAKGLKPLRP